MKVTINEVEYDTEDMTEDQQTLVAEVQGLTNVLQVLEAEIQVRQISAVAINRERQAKSDALITSIKEEDK